MRHIRNDFSSETKREAHKRSGGVCECHLIPHVFPNPCGLPIGDGNTFYEHINPDKISGRNDLSNCATLTKTCWRYKTDHYDQPTIAKTERQFDGARGIKHRYRKMLPGNKFDPFKLRINQFAAEPVDRQTGKRWGR